MKVKLAKSAGFCFGVKRAMDMVYQQIGTGRKIYTYGPIIHNEEVVKELEEKGVTVLNPEEIDRVSGGTVIIRSHGVERAVQEKLAARGLECVDATCPFVKRIHATVERESKQGRQILIAGNPEHPEVQGIMGWCETPAIVIKDEIDARNLEIVPQKEYCVVAQTTFNYTKFQKIVEIIKEKIYNVLIVDTICNATEERQTEARELSQAADAMIVIGGKKSSNTRKLYEICADCCENTYYVQTAADLRFELPESVGFVGITAGASTPNNIIEEVQNYVRINF